MANDIDDLLRWTAENAAAFLRGLSSRPVAARAAAAELRQTLGGSGLPENGTDARAVLEALVTAATPGIVASAGPRYFGFVVGGNHPSALAADWMTSAWDQNAFSYANSPAASVVEEIAAAWLLDLLGLPATASVGFTSGATMASFTGLAAARGAVLRKVGWEVEERGLIGAPPVHVVLGDEAHVTIAAALGLLGLGRSTAHRVKADGQGRMIPEDLRRVLAACDGPTIVCSQAGNVNTGAFDPLDELIAITRAHGAWMHVDGAFGLWAAVSPRLAGLVRGLAQA
jgi:glutamate/tyrosine decarboxylase-like PLP-dependent enzyme